MEKISWTDRVRNKDVLVRVREKQNILHTIKGKKIVLVAFWIGSALRKKVVKDIWKRREGEEEDVISYSVTWRNEKILEIERGSTRSRSVENSLWKSLWTCRKTDYVVDTGGVLRCDTMRFVHGYQLFGRTFCLSLHIKFTLQIFPKHCELFVRLHGFAS